jgi:hypothetical protein
MPEMSRREKRARAHKKKRDAISHNATSTSPAIKTSQPMVSADSHQSSEKIKPERPTARDRCLSTKRFFVRNSISLGALGVNFLTLLVLIYTLRAYQTTNDITRRALRVGKLPYLSLEELKCWIDADGVRISYKVTNDTDNPAIVKKYELKPIVPQYINFAAFSPLETNGQDWLAPNKPRYREYTFPPTRGGDIADLYNYIMAGVITFSITIVYDDVFGDELTYSCTAQYHDRDKALVITDAHVDGLPPPP